MSEGKPGALALVLLSLTEPKKRVPHPSVRHGGEGGLTCCRHALLGTALMFPFADMIQVEKLNPELHTSSPYTN